MPRNKRVIIMGAAGRDFHNFNTVFRDSPDFEVVAFTATQIPNIDGRKYPAELAGQRYPNGIPIFPETDLSKLVTSLHVDEVVFAYSDVSHVDVMHNASIVLASGSDFRLIGPHASALESIKPVISVCAVRTGCGKSQTTRKIVEFVSNCKKTPVVIRHPMPYGDLLKQKAQRFGSLEDLSKHHCTIEEREEFEEHIRNGITVFAGVDYQTILGRAEQEADVIIWDGGNNDLPFFKSDLEVVVVDPLRPGHERAYHPGEANLLRANIIVINKMDSATPENVKVLKETIKTANPSATVVEADSLLTVDNPHKLSGKKALIVEDGPTLTHGDMAFGAGWVAAKRHGVKAFVDPRPFAMGSLRETFQTYTQLGPVLPAMGYDTQQIKELQDTINSSDAEIVIVATPIDLSHVMDIQKETVRVHYALAERGNSLQTSITRFIDTA